MDEAEVWLAEIERRRTSGAGLEFDPAAFADKTAGPKGAECGFDSVV